AQRADRSRGPVLVALEPPTAGRGHRIRRRRRVGRGWFRRYNQRMSRFESATNIPTSLDSSSSMPTSQVSHTATPEAKLREAILEIAALRARDGLKTQFLANISHDLRTPLTAVITHAEILRDGILGDLTPRQLESVRGIISGGRQLLNQVGEILTYARGSADQLMVVPTRFAV